MGRTRRARSYTWLIRSLTSGDRRWRLAGLAEETVQADGERLTPALVQLAQNAVTHTHDGDLIELGSAVRDGRVELWVRDTGPGVDEEARERILKSISCLLGWTFSLTWRASAADVKRP
jgi:signal transduction histidine kinase